MLSICYSQWFYLSHEGIQRGYFVATPDSMHNYSPVIIDMHGFTMTAHDEYNYTQMNYFANMENIIVVYPQGINNSWNVGTYWDSNTSDDVGFIDLLIDDLALNFNIDMNRIYACGLSNGGYMAYELACELSHRITAFASVTGNFMLNTSQECDNDRDIPIIHIHGTYDNVVNY